MGWNVGTTIFEGIVEEIVDQIGEVHRVGQDDGIFCFEERFEFSASGFHFELEGGGHFCYNGVGIEFVEFEICGLRIVKHRELQYLFDEQAQAFRFIANHFVVAT